MSYAVTNEDILFDLEYRGIDAFLTDMKYGLRVPTSLVNRIKQIVETSYGITLRVKTVTEKTFTGTFCLIAHTDETMTVLVS